MKLPSLIPLLTATAVAVPAAAAAATTGSPESIAWVTLFFAFTTFYSEIIASVPSIRANSIAQQIGNVLRTLATILRRTRG